MAAIEKLLVQIFNQKRQIIEDLKHQKQLYDQHLLSKLLIQGISPPPWLLNSDFQSSTSDLTAFNKEELISGILLPKSGRLVSYPSGPCFLHDKPIITAADSSIPNEGFAVKCASNHGIDENGHGVAPLCHVNGTEDTASVVPLSHVDDFVDTSNYVSMSPEEQTGRRLVSCPSGPCFLYDKPIITAANSSIPDEVCAVKCASNHDIDEDGLGVAPLCHVDGTEDTASIVPPSHVDGFVDTSNYVPMSPEDQIGTRLSNAYKPEQSLVRIQRSRSRQKALEFRNSAKTSGKSRLGMERDVAISSGSKTCRSDEQFDGLRKSLELLEPFASSGEINSHKEVANGNSSNKERSTDARGDSLVQSTSTKEKVVSSGDSEIEKRSSCYGGRITRSKSCSQHHIGIASGSNPYTYSKHLDGSSGSLKLAETSRLHTETCSNEAAVVGNCSDKRKSINAFGDSLVQSTGSKAKVVSSIDSEMEKRSSIYGGRITRSKSSSQQSIGISSGSNLYTYGKHHDGSSGSLKLPEPSKLPTATCSNEAAEVGNCSDNGRSINACGNSLVQSAGSKAKVVNSGDSEIAEVLFKSDRISGQILILPDCLGDLQASLDFEATEIARLSPGCTSGGSLVPVTDIAPVVTRDKVKSVQSVEKMKLGSPSKSAASQPSTSFSHEKEVGGSKLPVLGAETNMLPDYNFSHAMDGSWPCYKRRKIEFKNLNRSASPTLMVNPFHASNENIANRTAGGKEESISSMSQNLTNSHYSSAALSNCAKENEQRVSLSCSKEHVLTPQVQCQKDDISLGNIVKTFTCEPRQLFATDVRNTNQSIIVELSDPLPKDGKVETDAPSAVFCNGRESDNLVNDQDLVDGSTVVQLMDIKMAVDQRKSSEKVDDFKFSIVSPLLEFMNVAEANPTVPEFEGFVISENADDAENSGDELVHEDIPFLSNIMDRTSLPEKICNSATLSTPVSPLPPACKLYLAPGIYSSVPNGLLENIDLQRNLLSSGRALLGKSHSDIFSFHMRKPFLSPSEKGFEGITSKSGGSGKLGSSNPELTCYPILEDPESSEEDVNDAVNTDVKRTDSTLENSDKREAIFDTSVQNNSSLAPDHEVERGSLESVNTDFKRTESITSSSMNQKPLNDITLPNEGNKSGLGQRRSRQTRSEKENKGFSVGANSGRQTRSGKENKGFSVGANNSRQTRSGKENKGFSVGANSSKKHSKELSSRFSKPKLSGKSSLRSRGQSLSEKEQKHNNIVSNIKSFLPLVQQKQAASVIPEKRDVKVKALQAAEAAKRAAEKREIERNQKKEAMKLERARMEQENMKEIVLKKKLKEEERKKKEAEIAAKKRQREEEEKREKEKKRRRIEEARLQHKQAEEKLQAWREESQCAAEDERARQIKDSDEKIEKQVDEGNEGDDSGLPVNDLVVVGNIGRDADDGLATFTDHKMSTGSSATGKVGSIDMAETSTPNCEKNDKPISKTSAQHSYDISPYQCSDDEEEEEDDIPNKKFVPTWASKSFVASALSSLQHMDPDVIFPPGSFCSLEEVLLPRSLQQK